MSKSVDAFNEHYSNRRGPQRRRAGPPLRNLLLLRRHGLHRPPQLRRRLHPSSATGATTPPHRALSVIRTPRRRPPSLKLLRSLISTRSPVRSSTTPPSSTRPPSRPSSQRLRQLLPPSPPPTPRPSTPRRSSLCPWTPLRISLIASRSPTTSQEIIDASGHHSGLNRMGIMTGLAIAIHNFPEGLATFVAGPRRPQRRARPRSRHRPPQHPRGRLRRDAGLLRHREQVEGVLLVLPVWHHGAHRRHRRVPHPLEQASRPSPTPSCLGWSAA